MSSELDELRLFFFFFEYKMEYFFVKIFYAKRNKNFFQKF